MAEKVTIMRHFNNPIIKSYVNNDEISLSIDLKDFFDAVATEFDVNGLEIKLRDSIGSVTYVFRKDTFAGILAKALADVDIKKRLEDAFKEVLRKVKEESSKVV